MAAVRYYRVDTQEGASTRPAFFYETHHGMYDLQYGWGQYTTKMHRTLEAAVEEFRQRLQAEHDRAGDGIVVGVSNPIEVSRAEVENYSPSKMASAFEKTRKAVDRARELTEIELGRTLEPAQSIWGWTVDDNGQPIVFLELTDSTTSVGTSFTPNELFDEARMEHRLIRLWGDLLEKRSRKLLEPIYESIRQHRAAEGAVQD